MLKLNGKAIIPINEFPDGTLRLDASPFFNSDNYGFGENTSSVTITWYFENNEELLVLMFYVKHLHSQGIQNIILEMPYIPNARQDRVKDKNDVFTLKYFSEIINSLKFKEVKVLDPHSHVSSALINNIKIASPERYVIAAINDIHLYASSNNIKMGPSDLTLFFPDEGAMKRYDSISKLLPYTFGVKHRDWKNGEILGLEVNGSTEEYVNNRNILIVDDICSKGGTFYHSAKKLKELGALKIFLFVSHCENSIFEGELLKDNDIIERVYTTNSLVRDEHEKIHTFKM